MLGNTQLTLNLEAGTQILNFKHEQFILNMKNFQMSLHLDCWQKVILYKLTCFLKGCNHSIICKLNPMCLYNQGFFKKIAFKIQRSLRTLKCFSGHTAVPQSTGTHGHSVRWRILCASKPYLGMCNHF